MSALLCIVTAHRENLCALYYILQVIIKLKQPTFELLKKPNTLKYWYMSG